MDFHTSNTESRTGWDHISAKIGGCFCAQSREGTAIQGTSSIVFPRKWSSTTRLNRSSCVVFDHFWGTFQADAPGQRRRHCATSCQARRSQHAECFTLDHLSATSSQCCPWWRRSEWEHGSQTAVA